MLGRGKRRVYLLLLAVFLILGLSAVGLGFLGYRKISAYRKSPRAHISQLLACFHSNMPWNVFYQKSILKKGSPFYDIYIRRRIYSDAHSIFDASIIQRLKIDLESLPLYEILSLAQYFPQQDILDNTYICNLAIDYFERKGKFISPTLMGYLFTRRELDYIKFMNLYSSLISPDNVITLNRIFLAHVSYKDPRFSAFITWNANYFENLNQGRSCSSYGRDMDIDDDNPFGGFLHTDSPYYDQVNRNFFNSDYEKGNNSERFSVHSMLARNSLPYNYHCMSIFDDSDENEVTRILQYIKSNESHIQPYIFCDLAQLRHCTAKQLEFAIPRLLTINALYAAAAFEYYCSNYPAQADAFALPYLRGPDSLFKKDLIVILCKNNRTLGAQHIDEAFSGKAPRQLHFRHLSQFEYAESTREYINIARHDYQETGLCFLPAYIKLPLSNERELLRDFIKKYPWHPACDDAYYRLASSYYRTSEPLEAWRVIKQYRNFDLANDTAHSYMTLLAKLLCLEPAIYGMDSYADDVKYLLNLPSLLFSDSQSPDEFLQHVNHFFENKPLTIFFGYTDKDYDVYLSIFHILKEYNEQKYGFYEKLKLICSLFQSRYGEQSSSILKILYFCEDVPNINCRNDGYLSLDTLCESSTETDPFAIIDQFPIGLPLWSNFALPEGFIDSEIQKLQTPKLIENAAPTLLQWYQLHQSASSGFLHSHYSYLISTRFPKSETKHN